MGFEVCRVYPAVGLLIYVSMMIVMMNMTLLLIISHLIPALPWPQEDLARSSSNMLFHTARLTEDKRMMMMVMMLIIINHFAYKK